MEIKVGRFPPWLRKALKAGLLTYQEAEVIHKLTYLADWPETVPAPSFLETKMEALYLLESRGFRA